MLRRTCLLGQPPHKTGEGVETLLSVLLSPDLEVELLHRSIVGFVTKHHKSRLHTAPALFVKYCSRPALRQGCETV